MADPSPLKPASKVHILIILMGSIGDVVRGLCLVSHIKHHLPESRITWLVEPLCAQLLDCQPQIDKIIVFNRSRNLPGVWNLYKELSKEHFDITLDLQRHVKSGFFSLLSKAKKRIGFHKNNAKEFNWLFNTEYINYFSDDLSKLSHYLEFTKPLGLPEPTALDFGFSTINLKETAPTIFKKVGTPFVAVVMGSSWDSKDWIFEGYEQLVKNILSNGTLQVVLLGDKSKINAAAKLSENIGLSDFSSCAKSRLINLVGETSLLDVVAILKAAAAAVGPDSGPCHIASAVGTPYVSLFGPTSPIRVAPYGNEHLVIQADISCSSCYKKHCPGLDKLCMSSISVESVEEKLTEALNAR